MVTVYATKIDWWLYPLLFVPLVSSALSILFGHDHTTVFVGWAALAAYALLMLTLGWPIRYTISPEELEVRGLDGLLAEPATRVRAAANVRS